MEELNAEELQQLEERLYSEVHHTFSNANTFSPLETQTKNINTEETSNFSKFLSKRYWTNKSDETTSVNTPERQNKDTSKVQKRVRPQSSSASLITTTNTTTARCNQNNKKQSNNNNNKYRNPFASPFCNAKGNHVHQNKQFQRNNKQFAEKVQKLQRFTELKYKKQKARNAHEKMLINAKVIANIELDSENDNDDEVIHVPIPPAPVVNIDDSDEEVVIDKANTNKDLNSLLDNRFVSPQTKNTSASGANENALDNASRCTSPCSVMSHDDFIGQNDRYRLLGGTCIANDDDLLILNSNTESLLEPSTPPATNLEQDNLERKSDEDIECIGTFIKPTYSIENSKKKDNGEKNYRVGETPFRALDVYESESDIASNGVYTKGTRKSQLPKTSIRNLDNSSDEEMDISQNPVKTKRLRKRRASGTLRNSESNASETTESESENDGVESTGIPFILRGPAVESHKSKKKRKHTISTGHMSDTEFVATLNSLAQGEQNNNSVDESESDEPEKIITARELAESALKSLNSNQARNNLKEQPSTSSASQNLTKSDAVPVSIPPPPIFNIDDSDDEVVIEEAIIKKDLNSANKKQAKIQRKIDEDIECVNTFIKSKKNINDKKNDRIGGTEFSGSELEIASDGVYTKGSKKPRLSKTSIGNLDKSSGAEMEISQNPVQKSLNPIRAGNNTEAEQPTTSAASHNSTNDDAVPLEIAKDIENLFDKINEFDGKRAAEKNDEEYNDIVIGDLPTTENVEIHDSFEKDEDDDEDVIKYFIGYTPANSKCISDGFGWNEEMQRFYNDSWGGELFNEEDIWKTMPRHPSLWRILDADRLPNMFGRNKREKCMNCRTFGHSRAKCPRPKRPLICYMCGQSGHLEARCPDTRCLRCGHKTTVFTQSCKKCMFWNNRICPICKLRGHSLNDCPDKWRRYHSTTKPNVYPNAKVKYNTKRFCSFCAKPGHLSDECREAFYKTEYPLISTEIKSHEKSYDDIIISGHRSPGIACRLLFDPNLHPKFTMAEKTKRFEVYGRFLSAVGLRKLIGKPTNTIQRAITSTTITMPVKTPEQVPEITEGKGNKKTSNKAQKSKTNNASDTEQETLALTSSQQMPPPLKPVDQPLIIDTADSDSNYSFSDHFEMPSTSSASKKLTKPPLNQTSPKKTTQLPDFIPLGGGNRFQETPMHEELIEIENSPSSFGISSRFVESYSDDEHLMSVPADVSPAIDQNKACEAKIYISDEHHKYFQTEIGKKYLKKIISENKLTGQLNRTIVGYALFLNGLPNDQDKLQRELELKFKELNREKPLSTQNEFLVPKNVYALKRLLQDGIKQLIYTNLGNATDLYKQMNELEKKATKSSLKTADRMRRTLNMIFIGQAGLNNGDDHFDTLLKGLHELTYNYSGIEQATFEMRKKLSASWRMIFTPHNHKNYSTLMLSYLKLSHNMRNRLLGLKIDNQLLGNAVVNVTFTKEQKERMNEFTRHDVQVKLEPMLKTNANNIEEDAPLLLNVVVPDKKETKQKQKASSNNNESNKNAKIKMQNENSNEQTKIQPIECKEQKEDEKDLSNIQTQQSPMANNENKQQEKQESEKTTNNETASKTTNKTQSENISSNLIKQNKDSAKKTSTPLVQTELVINKPENSSLCELDNTICQNLFEALEIKKTVNTSCKVIASKIPSEFWSRESQKLLIDLIDLAKCSKSSKNIERLNDIYKHAIEHKLSYNDYNCLVKLHNYVIKKK